MMLAALVRRAAVVTRQRCTQAFSSSAISRKDLVQDLYLRELRSYKPAPTAADAHVGSVKVFTRPATPKPPTLPADLAAQVTAYESSEPTKNAPVMTASGETETGEGPEEFLELLQQDIPKPVAHH